MASDVPLFFTPCFTSPLVYPSASEMLEEEMLHDPETLPI